MKLNSIINSIFLLLFISVMVFLFSLLFPSKNPIVYKKSLLAYHHRKLIQKSVQIPNIRIDVSKDITSKYKTVQSAVEAAKAMRRSNSEERIEIYVRAGVYDEIVMVPKNLTDLTMVGDGIGKTIITGSNSVARGYKTFNSATFSVFGDRFIAKDITFRNTYGPGSQAVALLSTSDQSIFYRCSFEGYQDTLYAHSERQFYRECDIYGTIDFIFGNAAVVIQKSNIFLRKPSHGGSNVITAQGRSDPHNETGIVIQFSHITAAPELSPMRNMVKSYLGRPWKEYSCTVYIENTIDDIIDPVGWSPMHGRLGLDTVYYAEYNNVGKGSWSTFRVKWSGLHKIKSSSQVEKFTVANFIEGGAWLPATGVPYQLGL